MGSKGLWADSETTQPLGFPGTPCPLAISGWP
jgi:hypothetical protein